MRFQAHERRAVTGIGRDEAEKLVTDRRSDQKVETTRVSKLRAASTSAASPMGRRGQARPAQGGTAHPRDSRNRTS